MPTRYVINLLLLLTVIGCAAYLYTLWESDLIEQKFPPTIGNQGSGDESNAQQSPSNEQAPHSETGKYVGSAVCSNCHSEQSNLWQGSHHDESMAHASPQTVKGNFDNQSLTALGMEHRFYQRDNTFWVSTEGSRGERAEFKVLYTFGTEPLQQYLVEMNKGRLQALPLAWDTEKKSWFHLQADLKPKPGEWIHWTQGGMNWNSMCADCHSTGLSKNFDSKTREYDTRWEGIDVGCEACHGPGSLHVAQAGEGITPSKETLDMIRGESAAELVDKCGRCHARRQPLTPVFKHNSDTMLDHYLPMTLQNGPYYSDGQINEEVFVYGSFTQSKMYAMGVSCVDCHNPHSTRLVRKGNSLCTGCHLSEQYDTSKHHHHPTSEAHASDTYSTGTGNQCVDCHMPGRNYMTNDFRRDHSLRIPRPDLSVEFGTPNACNSCHQDKNPEWAAQKIKLWYGEKRPAHFSEILARAIGGEEEVITTVQPLAKLLRATNQPAIARATAADLLAPLLQEPEAARVLQQALSDTSPLVRVSAVSAYYNAPMHYKLPLLTPLLADPVLAVRISAAKSLSEMNDMQFLNLEPETQRQYQQALEAYQRSLEINDDFVSSSHQRGLDLEKAGHLGAAARQYEHALTIDDRANASRMNLAQIHYQYQQYERAEALYRKVLSQEPDAVPSRYALGLLLAEMGKKEEAEDHLEIAAKGGNNARIWYNLGVLRHQRQDWKPAETAYRKALALAPDNVDYVSALASLLVQQEEYDQAKTLIDKSLHLVPNEQKLLRFKRYLDSLGIN
ncbi:tetratricopeptide repeat protein [Microbulbifer pacificus]|uniref:tetratricopeptide repeat protein n=1 Tax=Microbulbifer pacificus TaxID=407164 RepID=UPI000CF4C6B5|nr:tetratricopeptide repeat protein [Microbulbifer pacificus]